METFYEVRDANNEVIGTYEHFDTAKMHQDVSPGATLRFFDGEIWIYNVTSKRE